MNKYKTTVLVITVLCSLLLVAQAMAMSSTNYRLDWFVPLSGTGGSSSSTNYAVNFTVGQTAIGSSTSSTYKGCLGYWCGLIDWRLFLPLILKN